MYNTPRTGRIVFAACDFHIALMAHEVAHSFGDISVVIRDKRLTSFIGSYITLTVTVFVEVFVRERRIQLWKIASIAIYTRNSKSSLVLNQHFKIMIRKIKILFELQSQMKKKSGKKKNQEQCNKVAETKIIDNNSIVPNQSTNQNSSFVLNTSNLSKSSISVGKCIANQQQSSKFCISYVRSHSQENDQNSKPISTIDTTFSTFPTSSTISTTNINTSSIMNNLYSKENYENRECASFHKYHEDCTLKMSSMDEGCSIKTDEIQPPPDRSSSGKYVCTYCNLVCSKPSVLQKHIRAHTNERPYPCISCGFSFKTRSNLYKHCRSRTHANRVMGNKSQPFTNEMDNQKSSISPKMSINQLEMKEEESCTNVKLKPYKPRFHSSKHFHQNISKENVNDEKQKHAKSELLSHHINEIIDKNNSIVNSKESSFIKKHIGDLFVDNVNNNEHVQRSSKNDSIHAICNIEQNNSNEPLNLTNKNRKRCMSEISEPVAQKSLIKELLLKNLYSSDMQCPYCKMIFQTVTELDVHKYRNCKGKPLDTRYTRSNSVNVASILTQNKNAFDNMPQFQSAIFPLSSPGPFLGKTHLVETDKTKSFSFDSAPVKLFGGEVKIHSLGETKSFKIDNKESTSELDQNYPEYEGKLSENRVIKSSLQSGGTVLTNETNYKKQEIRSQHDVIRVYENTSISPSIDISGINQSKFNFDCQTGAADIRQSDIILRHKSDSPEVSKSKDGVCNAVLYKCTNITDFSQKAVKMLTPNIKQPNFVSHLSNNFINKSLDKSSRVESLLNSVKTAASVENNVNTFHTLSLGSDLNVPNNDSPIKQLHKNEHDYHPVTGNSSLYNPVSLLVNGKVIRYVPGMPGPIATEDPVDMVTDNPALPVMSVSRESVKTDLQVNNKLVPPNNTLTRSISSNSFQVEKSVESSSRSPKLDVVSVTDTDIYSNVAEMKSPQKVTVPNSSTKLLETKPVEKDKVKETKKFARPNSLALKPTTASLKQHHGLTPTIFNQILISPDTPRVAKKYAEHFLHGNYFSYLGLKSSTKPVYCTLNKTQPFYVPHFKKLSMYSEWRQQDTKTDKLYVSNYDSRQKGERYTTAGKTSADLIIHSSYKFILSESASTKDDSEEELPKNRNNLGGYEYNSEDIYIRGRGKNIQLF
ncbi:hypothetical protein NQ315_007994 [Exocentrus adspersus]|uniref:C2H2-type domain-containing protein n=1 Tax=Exocentrus adspersus TaxID=1586481 RepID=A0AAV8VFP7_9CUCU|nr:hypothetical protein NQ315_007994 [Exocentrus adspersus]